MYHCPVTFYLVGLPDEIARIIEDAQPQPSFTHHFTRSDEPEEALTAQASAIFADATGHDAAAWARVTGQQGEPGLVGSPWRTISCSGSCPVARKPSRRPGQSMLWKPAPQTRQLSSGKVTDSSVCRVKMCTFPGQALSR